MSWILKINMINQIILIMNNSQYVDWLKLVPKVSSLL